MRVAFIGLGIMGSRQAANLVRAGHELHVFNRTRETADAWAQEHGATVAGSPREAADSADAVITMVVDGGQVEAMLLGGGGGGAGGRGAQVEGMLPRDQGAAQGAPGGTLFIDCTTIAPADARRIGTTLTDAG